MLNKFTLSFFSICALAYCANANNVGKLNLDEVVVTASGFESSLKDETRNVYVVGEKEISRKGYRTVREALEKIPSVSFLNSGVGESVDIRGQGNKANTAVKVMINGVAINMLDNAHMIVPIEMIAIEDVERIEVMPGGGSVLYGSGTRGGVINIITKNSPREFYGNIQSKIGSYRYHDMSINLGGNVSENLFLKLGAKAFDTNSYHEDGKEKGSYVSAAANYQISDGQNLAISSSLYRSKLKLPATMLSKKEVAKNRRMNQYPNHQTSSENMRKTDIALDYRIESGNFTFNLKPFYQKIKITNFNDIPSVAIPNAKYKEYKVDGLFGDEKTGLNFKTKYDYTDGEFIAGFDFTKNQGDRAQYIFYDVDISMRGKIINMKHNIDTILDLQKRSYALYFMEKHNFTPNFDLSAGARVERAKYDAKRISSLIMKSPNPHMNNASISNFSTKNTHNNYALEITPNFKYSDTGNLYFKFERGYISPSPTQLTNKDLKTKKYSFNNIKSETFQTYEIGLKDEIASNFSLASSLFLTDSKDEIHYTAVGGHGDGWKYENLDKTRRVGFELSLKEQISEWLDLTQSYSFVDAKEKSGKNSGKEVPFVSKHKFVFGMTYEPVQNLSLFADMKFYSKQNDSNREKNIKSRAITDVGAEYKFKSGLSFGAGVNNLFNKKYFDYADVENDAYIPANERNFYARIKYEF